MDSECQEGELGEGRAQQEAQSRRAAGNSDADPLRASAGSSERGSQALGATQPGWEARLPRGHALGSLTAGSSSANRGEH